MTRLNRDNSILVYTNNTCVRCKQLTRVLDTLKISYRTINLDDIDGTERRRVTEELKSLGFSSLPVVLGFKV